MAEIVMDIPGLLTHLIQAELEPPDKTHRRLRVGDVLQLRVLEVISANRVRVDLGRFRAVADIQFPVAPGDELRVEVAAAGRQLRLQVSPAKDAVPSEQAAVIPNTYFLVRRARPLGQAVNRFITRLESGGTAAGLPERVVSALRAVAAHLAPLHPQGDIEHLANRVKDKVEASGLFFEKKLEAMVSGLSADRDKLPKEILQHAQRLVRGDFKAQLMVLKDFLDKPSDIADRALAESGRQLNRAVANLLSDIHTQQTHVRQTDPHQLFHVVLYDLNIQDDRRNGLLKMYFPRRGRGHGRNSFRLSLLLSLDRLGDIRGDIVLQESDLTVMFFVAEEPVRAQFESRLETVREALRAHFARVTVSVTLAEKKLVEFETDLLQADGDRKIDMRI
jgi:hypothetical protein